jgi:hypothetical protein
MNLLAKNSNPVYTNHMTFRFPLKDVTIKITEQKTKVTFPVHSDNDSEINQHEFTLDVEGIAWFYASNGNYIEIYLYEEYNKTTLELYLNGSVYGAILHQRFILPLHGSCFNYNGYGIMVCGESGMGKSSLTAAFCLQGSEFLTDDITPMIINDGLPFLLTLSDRIKLWDDALEQLALQKEGLLKIDTDTEKFYFPINNNKKDLFPLHTLFVLEIHDKMEVEFQEIRGGEKLTSIRNQIYRLEYLLGMPENESAYFQYLVDICNNAKIIRVKRPVNIHIHRLMGLLKNYMPS